MKIKARIDLLALAAQAAPLDKQLGVEAPHTYYEAMHNINKNCWKKAMDEEIFKMEEFGVWKLVPMVEGKNLMSCRWVFALKRDVANKIGDLKARLTCRGFTQREGVDFGATWAPTCRMRVFRMLMAEASADKQAMTAQWDCTSAFLHAPVDYEMYMTQPPGYEVVNEDGGARMVCRLLRAIYGCKQSSKLFHDMVKEELTGIGFVQAKADECLFLLNRGTSYMRVLVHVDDFACTFNDRAMYEEVFAAVKGKFKITDYGPISRFCGICVERTEEGKYRLHQRPYIEELLVRLGLVGQKGPCLSPEKSGTKAKLRPVEEMTQEEEEFMRAVPFKEAVGALFYLARSTRFDIAHACGQVARFMDRPAPSHWEAVLRIYRYLARTKEVALVMGSEGMECELVNQFLEGFSDSDWAGCSETRKSHTGWLIRVGGSLVAWYSKRQTSVSQSTTEAEYVAAASAANEVIWWRRPCQHLGYECNAPVKIWCDNRSATVLAEHEGRFDAIKHIQLRYHVLRDYQARGLVKLVWRASKKMWADVLTKNCVPHHFRRIVSELMGEEV